MSISTGENNTALFKSGQNLPDLPNCLWLITQGVVKSYTISEEGSSITLGFWGAEDVVGESLSNVVPYALECIGQVQAIAIHRQDWQTISSNLLRHAQQTQHMLYIVRNNRVSQRLMLLLKWLADKFGRTISQGRLIDFKLTHQELADALDTTRITVTKTLNLFEDKGLIWRPKTKCIVLRQ